jgi:predicted site-specific integrase-resolvase
MVEYYKTGGGYFYKTYKNGKIKCIRSHGGKRYYDIKDFINEYKNDNLNEIEDKIEDDKRKFICYCRVSSYSQKKN